MPSTMLNRGLLSLAVLPFLFEVVRAEADFQKDIRPVLQARCFSCHGSQKQKGNLDLERYVHLGQITADLKQWKAVAEAVSSKQMPPKGHMGPDDKQREEIVRWIEGVVKEAENASPSDPGPSLPRRVTRREYRQLIHDIFGTDPDVDTYLPEARSPSGYDNQIAQLSVTPELMEKYLLLADRILDGAWPNIYNTRQKDPVKLWCVAWAGEKGVAPRAAAEQNLRQLARLAFRRPPDDKEVEILLKLFDKAFADKKDFHASLRYAVKGLLVSPQVLFRAEALPDEGKITPVDDYELASRLSFFLWSSVPDEELLKHAAANDLHEPEVLRAQVRRMIRDPKVRRLASDFPQQWLFGRLSTHRLDQFLFPDYTPALEKAANEELALCFESILQGSRSSAELLDADYTFLNDDLAAVYGVKDIKGPEMRRVALTDRRRGGLVGMATVLQKTSMPNRTSPTIRGKWVLDSLLGMAPPPPPNDVDNSVVDGKKPGADGRVLSFREKLNLHAQDGSSCMNCHKKMDPIGFSLENFDPLGRFREKDSGRPVDVGGKLPDGTELVGPESVKQVLMNRKEQFARNLAEQMLTYALGRDLQPYDLPTIRLMTARVREKDYRADVMVEEVVLSYPFLHKRAPRSAELPATSEVQPR